MSDWISTNVTMPGHISDANLPADLAEVAGFTHYNRDLTLDIEDGQSVALQRVGPGGTWETFETATEKINKIEVVNMPAIRFVPTGEMRISWSQ